MIDIFDVDDIVVSGVDSKDYPDFADAYVESATADGKPLTDEQLDWLNENHPEIAQELAYESLL